jgi:glycosyltransferase involved in cell wall biosynthesis
MGWSDGRPVVAFVGAMGDRRKGFDSLFAAWAMLAAGSSWDARLVVLGAGASVSEWEARAEAEGLSGSIAFLGFRKDVSAILAGCDVLVSPTRYEAYGLNVQEALCCGLPALVSASAGVAERYPESLSGLLLPDAEDAADLAARLRSWRDQSQAIRDLVVPLSDRLRARTWDVMAREIAEAAGAGGPPGTE